MFIDDGLISSIDRTTRAQRTAIFLRVFDLYPSVSEGVDAIAAILCEKRELIQLWRCKDPRAIPASKLKVLLTTLKNK
jgi:hypothetical protein